MPDETKTRSAGVGAQPRSIYMSSEREARACRLCNELTNAPNRVCGRHYPFGRSTANRTVLALKGTDLKQSRGAKRLLGLGR
jgi:hypothetical protein